MTLTIAQIILIVAGLTAVLLLLPRLARPTVPFGVRVPDSYVDAPVIREATRQYRRNTVVTMLMVTALLAALAPLASPTVVLTIASIVPLVAWLVPFFTARRTVLAAKRAEGWYEGVRQTVAADTSLRTSPPPYPWPWAVPAIVLALATVGIGVAVYPSLPEQIAVHIGTSGPDRFAETTVWSAFGPVAMQLLLTALLLGLTAVTLRSKADLAATSPRTSAEQYRRYASAMARSVLVLAAGMNLTMVVTALMLWDVVPPSGGWLAASAVPALVAAAALIVVAVRTGQSGHRLRADVRDEPAPPDTAHRDDDAHWIGGLLYVNRDDPALWVPKRFGGVGWTVNFGRPAAWLLLGGLLAVAIGLPIWAASSTGTDEPTPAGQTAPATATPAADPSDPPAADLSAIEGTPVADRLAWVLDALAEPPAEADIEAAFDSVVLAEASPAELHGVFVQFAGDYEVTALHRATPTELTVEIDDGSSRWQLQLATTEADEPQITGLFFRPPLADPPTFGSWDDAGSALRGLADDVTFLAAEVDGTTCQPITGHDADVRRPVGSLFKLYVLGAVADAVEAGEVSWDDEIVIDANLQSLPTGRLQDAEPGSSVSVAEAAKLMISISDNTATDHLIDLVGRETIEQAQAAYGHQGPEVNRPFLTTREFFQLKWQLDDAARTGYVEADENGRRAILDDLDEQPLAVEPTDITGPEATETISWFASTEELCAALAALDRVSAQEGMEPVAEVLGSNPIVRLDTDRWTRFAAKGGSEPGVLAFAWLLERTDGAVFSFAVTMLDEQPINQFEAVPVVEGALNLLADEGGEP